jgi:hypothetical protein
MDLIKIQNILVKLYTEKTYREDFFLRQKAFIKKLNCDEREEKLLLGLDEDRVCSFADSLLWKRFGLIEKSVTEIVEKNYNTQKEQAFVSKLFFEYAENKPVKLGDSRKTDIKDFTEYVQSNKISSSILA